MKQTKDKKNIEKKNKQLKKDNIKKNQDKNQIKDEIIDILKNIYDPEIPINIYDLGLIYEIIINQEKKEIKIKTMMTSPTCPLSGYILEEMNQKINEMLKRENIGYKLDIDLIFDPPWTPERMNPSVREQYGY